MSTTYLITAKQVTEAALRKLGVIAQGDSAEPVQLSEALFAFNNLAGRFFTMGLPAYLETDVFIVPTLGATEMETTVEGGLWNVYQAFLHDTATKIDIPLRVISREEYNNLTNKSAMGTPVSVAVNPNGRYFYSYLVPDQVIVNTKLFKLRGYVQNTVLSGGSDQLFFPREWSDALIYNLAYNLSFEYGVSLDVKSSLKNDADAYLRDAINWNPEPTSIYFGEDTYGRS